MPTKLTTEEFIQRAKKVHGDKYDYSKSVYVNIDTKVIINCPEHGDFELSPNRHIYGKRGCKHCGWCKLSNSKSKSHTQFIAEVSGIHYNYYDYSKTIYTRANKHITIICPEHGEFTQLANSHKQGRGCPNCNTSKGERKVAHTLDTLNIDYIQQHMFNDCKHKQRLAFDFYIPSYKICIEYDGEQHFKSIKAFGGDKTLKRVQMLDDIKNTYLKSNKISVLRIPYTDYDNIKSILTDTFSIVE